MHSTVPATPSGVDARLRDERVFNIASSGENADTESIPNQDFQDHLSVSKDGSQDGVSIADAQPQPDEFVGRVEFLQFAPAGRRTMRAETHSESILRARKIEFES